MIVEAVESVDHHVEAVDVDVESVVESVGKAVDC